MKRFGFVFLYSLCGLVLAAPSYAGALKGEDKLNLRTEQLLSAMNDAQKTEFAQIKLAHGVVRAVENTNGSIAKAVKSCGKHNPPLKSQIESDYKDWKTKISPTLRHAESRLDQMIRQQDFAKPLVVRSYLKEYDDVATARNKTIVDVPVTKSEDCTALMKKMADVDDELVSLLVETLRLNEKF